MKKKKVLIVSGAISGVVFALSWLVLQSYMTEAIGYLTMLIALSTVYFGVRNYRDKNLGGRISFKDAFLNGMIVVLVASILYVVSWMIYYPNFIPDFADQYATGQIEALKETGITGAELEKEIKEIEEFNQTYKNPLVMAGFSFIEVFPVGIVVALLSAFFLKKKD